jgi:hypothetical protein
MTRRKEIVLVLLLAAVIAPFRPFAAAVTGVRAAELTTASETAAASETTPTATTDSFEDLLVGENFPESYKAGLRLLHAQYPDWIFKALHTGLDWGTVLGQENAAGRSLITTAKDGYKSTDTAAYDWLTNSWRIFDGSCAVQQSSPITWIPATFLIRPAFFSLRP